MSVDLSADGLAPNSKRKFTQLAIPEMMFYFIVWFAAVGYAILHVYQVSEEYFNQYFLDIYNDFDVGWSWIGRKVDIADIEWVQGLAHLNTMLAYYFIHFTVSEFLKNSGRPRLLPLWHIVTGSLFTISYLGVQTLIIYLIQPLVFYCILQTRKKILLWVFTIPLLVGIHYVFDLSQIENVEEYENYERKMRFTSVVLAWINIRCLNFFLDAVDDEQLRRFSLKNLVKVLSYCLYLPLLYFGPLILYSHFTSSRWNEKGRRRTPFIKRFQHLLKNFIRFGFWLLFLQFILHFFYITAIPFQLDLIKDMNHFSLYGAGYLMGQFFHMKYVVFYGISTSLTQFELEIEVPRTPKCIGRIHLYSDMWKHFDRGLYLFLVTYIYKPLVGTWGKLIGSLVCFAFVYVWHGTNPYLLVWSSLNYLGVVLEWGGRWLEQQPAFRACVSSLLGQRAYRRLGCLAAAPLFAMSALSFFYFCAGLDVGHVFASRLLAGPPHVQLALLAVLYCGSQVSVQIKHIEQQLQQPSPPPSPPPHARTRRTTATATPPPSPSPPPRKHTPVPCQRGMLYNDKLIKFKSTSQIEQKMNEQIFSSKKQHQQRMMYLESLKKAAKHDESSTATVRELQIRKPAEHVLNNELDQNIDMSIRRSFVEKSREDCLRKERSPERSKIPLKEKRKMKDSSPIKLKKDLKDDDLYVHERSVKKEIKTKMSERSIKDLSPKRLYELYKNTSKKRKNSLENNH